MAKKNGDRLTKDGSEVLDSTPLALSLRFKRPPSLAEQVRQLVRSERFAEMMRSQGHETFEESEDFDVGDEHDFESPWEENFEGQFDEEVALERTHYEQHHGERRRKPPRKPVSKTRSSEEEDEPGASNASRKKKAQKKSPPLAEDDEE